MSKKTQKASSHSRPFYSAEDKLRAVRRVREERLAVSAVCQHEGISESALRKCWRSTMPSNPVTRRRAVPSRLSSSAFVSWKKKISC